MCQSHNPRRHRFAKGYTPWNKGKTKETEPKLVRTEKYKASMRGAGNTFYGRKHTPESRILIRKNHADVSGINNPFFGKPSPNHGRLTSEETKRKISKANKGHHHSEEARRKIKERRASQVAPVRDTSIEVKVQNLLRMMEIEFFTHQYMREIEHKYQCDILIPSMKTIIECDGNYWHKYPIGREIDKIRTAELTAKGFRVIRLWESEIKTMTYQDFLNYIPETLKIVVETERKGIVGGL